MSSLMRNMSGLAGDIRCPQTKIRSDLMTNPTSLISAEKEMAEAIFAKLGIENLSDGQQQLIAAWVHFVVSGEECPRPDDKATMENANVLLSTIATMLEQCLSADPDQHGRVHRLMKVFLARPVAKPGSVLNR